DRNLSVTQRCVSGASLEGRRPSILRGPRIAAKRTQVRLLWRGQLRMTQIGNAPAMIVDFQHHFTPRELIKDDPGDRLVLHYDALGAPSYTVHALVYDLDE